MMDEDKDVLFSEVQRFRQLWIWIIAFLPVAIMIWHLTVEQHVMKQKPVKPDDFMILLTLGITFPVLMYILNLRTEVRPDALYFRFFPFHLSFRKIDLKDIEKYEARTYSPLMEYGGWGLRYSWKNGKAYNVSGNRGVQIQLKNGVKILFGSQRPEEFVEALTRCMGYNQQ